MKLTTEQISELAMADIDKVFKDNPDMPREIRLIATEGWIEGFRSGFQAGVEEMSESAGKLIEAFSEALRNKEE
jgi:hypothetical protein